MGERVVVNPSSEPERPTPAVPLNYAGPGASRLLNEKVIGVIEFLGGWRQIVFAFGLACCGAGIGECDLYDGSGDAAGWFLFGGLFLGFAIPVPRRKA